MNEDQRKQHVDNLLRQGKCRAEAFHDIGDQLLNGDIDRSDYLAMSEMLGFEIHFGEQKQIFQSLNKEFFRATGMDGHRPAIQKTAPQA